MDETPSGVSHNREETTMQALLNRWRSEPNTLLHARIIAYHRKHPFCECMLNDKDLALCRALCAFKA